MADGAADNKVAFDWLLKVSNAKRLGLRPRAGRVGVPDDVHPAIVNVDCSDYFMQLAEQVPEWLKPYLRSQFEEIATRLRTELAAAKDVE